MSSFLAKNLHVVTFYRHDKYRLIGFSQNRDQWETQNKLVLMRQNVLVLTRQNILVLAQQEKLVTVRKETTSDGCTP